MRRWHEVSERFSELPKSEFDKILQIAEEDRSVISLGPGEPNFNPGKHLITYAKKILSQGYTTYSPPIGIRELREAVAKKLKKENQISADPERIIVTTGSTEAIFLALLGSIDPGEGVLIPNPGFLNYFPVIETITGIPESYQLKMENDFAVNPDELKNVIQENTRVILINTPSNPTGTVLKKKILEEIADIAIENDILIFSDEAYEKFIYEKSKHVSMGSLNGMENHVVTFQTFSKTYSMPGFRIGYASGPQKLIAAMTRLHLYSSLCAPTPFQHVAKYALESTQAPVKKMVKEFGRRRKLLLRRLQEIGFHFVKPEGAFYAFPSIKNSGKTSVEFAHYLLKKASVLVVPGNEFGKFGEGFIRLSYATDYKKIETAMDRIQRTVKSL